MELYEVIEKLKELQDENQKLLDVIEKIKAGKEKPKYENGKWYKCYCTDKTYELLIHKSGKMYRYSDYTIYFELEDFEKIEPLEEPKKLGLWYVVDKDEECYIHYTKPFRVYSYWASSDLDIRLPKPLFPNMTWEDEPVEI